MGQFWGFVELEGSLSGQFLVKDASGIPANADALPTFRVYGESGLMTDAVGTAAIVDTGSVTDATFATPIVITSANHGLTTGTRVTITGVTGNTGANTTAPITVINANSFSLNSIAGTGSYVSGGTWNVTGLYQVTFSPTAGDGFARGQTYSVLTSALVSSVARGDLHTFTVV